MGILFINVIKVSFPLNIHSVHVDNSFSLLICISWMGQIGLFIWSRHYLIRSPFTLQCNFSKWHLPTLDRKFWKSQGGHSSFMMIVWTFNTSLILSSKFSSKMNSIRTYQLTYFYQSGRHSLDGMRGTDFLCAAFGRSQQWLSHLHLPLGLWW